MTSVQKEQVYLSEEDRRRNGSTRTVTIERVVMAKRAYDAKKQLYAAGVSRIDANPKCPDQVGKKRRVFIAVARLLSPQYTLLTTSVVETPQVGTPVMAGPC